MLNQSKAMVSNFINISNILFYVEKCKLSENLKDISKCMQWLDGCQMRTM